MSDEINSKVCTGCLVDKNLSEFYKDTSWKSGYRNKCKLCTARRPRIISPGETKICTFCKEDKEINKDNFYFTGGNFKSRCIKCYHGNWNKKSKDGPKSKKQNNLKARFNIDSEQYEHMLENQNGVCDICKKEEAKILKGTACRLSVDHCHKTGEIRGLLCARCNTGLGMFGDNVDVLLSAIEYIYKNLNKKDEEKIYCNINSVHTLQIKTCNNEKDCD